MLESYYHINQATGISINLLQNGGALINLCGVSIDHDRLTIEKKAIDLDGIEKISKYVQPKAFVALNMLGKGILLKKVEKMEAVNAENFHQVLPNANVDDFYVQNFVSGNMSWISIIRKTEADKWINMINAQGFVPLSLSLGPFAVENIVPQLNVYGEEMVFNGYAITHGESRWSAVKYDETIASPYPLKIESEPIDEKSLIPYANAFQLVLSERVNLVQAAVQTLAISLEKTLADKKFRVKGFVILGCFFLILLINFFVLSYFNAANKQLTNHLTRSVQSNSDLESINEKVKEKEALLKTLGWDNGVNKSNVVDQLASLLPDGISWQQISVNPIDQSTAPIQKVLQFMDGKIKVIGNAQSIIPVNEWIARVKSQKWVKSIQLDSYTYNNGINTGQFTVIIDY